MVIAAAINDSVAMEENLKEIKLKAIFNKSIALKRLNGRQTGIHFTAQITLFPSLTIHT